METKLRTNLIENKLSSEESLSQVYQKQAAMASMCCYETFSDKNTKKKILKFSFTDTGKPSVDDVLLQMKEEKAQPGRRKDKRQAQNMKTRKP